MRNFQRKVKGRWLVELYEFYLPLEVPEILGIVEWEPGVWKSHGKRMAA